MTSPSDPATEEWTLPLRSEAETAQAARALAGQLPEVLCVGLSGTLGAGKTCFSRALVGAMEGGERARVSSPTYAICHHYRTRPQVWHLDLYRLAGADDLESVGFFELLGEGIVLVEWPERVADASAVLDLHLHLGTDAASETQRSLRVRARSEAGLRVLRGWRTALGGDQA